MNSIHDATTVAFLRERLRGGGVIDALFEMFAESPALRAFKPKLFRSSTHSYPGILAAVFCVVVATQLPRREHGNQGREAARRLGRQTRPPAVEGFRRQVGNVQWN